MKHNKADREKLDRDQYEKSILASIMHANHDRETFGTGSIDGLVQGKGRSRSLREVYGQGSSSDVDGGDDDDLETLENGQDQVDVTPTSWVCALEGRRCTFQSDNLVLG